MGTLAYLKQELGFGSKDWATLSAEEKETLKKWAKEEMEKLGIPTK